MKKKKILKFKQFEDNTSDYLSGMKQSIAQSEPSSLRGMVLKSIADNHNIDVVVDDEELMTLEFEQSGEAANYCKSHNGKDFYCVLGKNGKLVSIKHK
jgi:hypothetical protein